MADKTKKSAADKKNSDKAVAGKKAMLFEPVKFRSVSVRNRIWLPPMDQYSVFNRDGVPTDFHYQHYVSRAFGGFGLIVTEATAVCPEGRISPEDVGLWDDRQIGAWRWIAKGISDAGAVPVMQLNHSGRKGSTGSFSAGYINASVPEDKGGWKTVAPSAVAFGNCAVPREMTADEIRNVINSFAAAAGRAVNAGFKGIEIHAAHGYLLSEFLDPLSNLRTDEYGGNFDNRIRILIETVDAVREAIGESLPLFVRISATDWAENGWDISQSVALAKILKQHGVDLIDVSTGGIIHGVNISAKAGYQVKFAREIKRKADIPVTAVGLITKPSQAEKILRKSSADAVEIGRAALRDPSWPLRAAWKLGLDKHEAPYAAQYIRGAYGTSR